MWKQPRTFCLALLLLPYIISPKPFRYMASCACMYQMCLGYFLIASGSPLWCFLCTGLSYVGRNILCANLSLLLHLSSLFCVLSSLQSLSSVQLFVTPWTAACQASLPITNFGSLLKLMSIELVMSSQFSLPIYIKYVYSFLSKVSLP